MTKKKSEIPNIVARFVCSLQSTGRTGKSTVAQMALSHADFAGVEWVALDTDAAHRTLSARWPDKVNLIENATTDPDSFKRMIDGVTKAAAAGIPLIVADFPAQATPFLLSTIERQRSLDVLAAAGVRMTVTLFPADDETALASLAQVVRALGDRVDYIIVRNPARFTTTRYDASPAAARLAELGAVELHLPVICASTLEEVNRAGSTAGRHLTLAEAAPLLPTSSRFELEYFINQVFAQAEDCAGHLYPSADILRQRVTRAAKPQARVPVDAFDPLSSL